MNNSTEKLSIAVASSLRYVFEELAVDFKGRAPDIGVDLMFASSGKLTAQIENGAPFDIFISADHSYIEYIKAQLPIAEEPRVFAEGKMVLWSMSPLSGKLLEDLSRAERIAIANPDVAPFGRAAIEVLDRLAIDGEVRARIVEGENIGQVNQFITLEAAQVGFTSRSVVLAPGCPMLGIGTTLQTACMILLSNRPSAWHKMQIWPVRLL